MATSQRDTVKQIMAEIFKIDARSIGDTAAMGSIEQWDSQNHVTLVLALEEEFNVVFEVSEIETMTTFERIMSTLEKKR